MSRKSRFAMICAALTCAAGIGVAVHAATGSDRGVCLKHPLRAKFGNGVSPSGLPWYVVGHLANNAECHSRLLEVSFYPSGRHSGVSFGTNYGIPIGGSLSSTFVISSRQVRVDKEIGYGGITSSKVALVEASTGDGQWTKIQPEKPQLSKVPTWLRNVRYFMSYPPANKKIELVRVRDRTGRVLYQGRETVFGEFDDVGVL